MCDRQNNSSKPYKVSHEAYRMLDESDGMYYFHWNMDNDILRFDTSVEKAPYDFVARIDKTSTRLGVEGYLHPDDVPLFNIFMNRVYRVSTRSKRPTKHEQMLNEIRLKARNSQEYLWAEVKLIIYFEENMPLIVFGRIRDINAQKVSQMKLQHAAEHDRLTGFLNKNATEQYVRRTLTRLAREETLSALLIIDADNFKAINDNFGHLFGDAVLTDMAMAIEKSFRHTDVMGRIGGDEFIVFFRNLPSLELLKQRTQDLIDTLTKDYESEGKKIHFSVSIGIALYPTHGHSYDELFTHADRALYDSKQRGKGCFSIYKSSFVAASYVATRDTQQVADLSQRAFKDNMIAFIFQLLYEMKDPDATISLSLSLLGKQFNIDRVAIDRYHPLTGSYSNAFEWLSPHGCSLVDNENYTAADFERLVNTRNNMILSRYKATPYGVMSICRDTTKLDECYQEAAKALKNAAFVHCKITRGSEDLGCIAFECATGPRTFTEDELSALSVFAVLLGNVLLSRQSDDALKQENKHLKNILDYMQEFVYVVDKDTYEPLFFNRTIRQAVIEGSTPEPCYRRFHGYDTPCEDCPLPELSKDGREYIICTVSDWGCNAGTRAYNIDWDDDANRHVALIITEPF